MRRLLGRWLLLIGELLLVTGLLLFVVEYAFLDTGFHLQTYAQLGSPAEAGLEDWETPLVAQAMVAYLRGDAATLTATVQNGAEFFNDREIAHMEDVRALFVAGRAARLVLLCAGLLLSVVGLLFAPDARMLLFACLALAGLFAITLAFCAASFDQVFLLFHKIAFTNDLWLLDPATDRMICLLPEPFFFAVARHAALATGLALALLTAIGALSRRFLRFSPSIT